MASLPKTDASYIQEFLPRLLNTPSPTGYCEQAIALMEKELSAFPKLKLSRTRKGALVATWKGKAANAPRALTAHVDTLGAMVKEIKSNGRLIMTPIGGFAWNTVEGEGCWVQASRGKAVRGSILINKASGHVYGKEMAETPREQANMEIRLDAQVFSEADVEDLGIRIGDFVTFDPRVEQTNGYIRSRHLDDKAGVAVLVAAIKALVEAGKTPAQTTYFHFSNYEEVGHGAASGIPTEVTELIAVDMAAVGEGQASDEYHATLCVKDSSGPYHHGLNQRLLALAEKHKIPCVTDIYPYYSSDASAFWNASGDVAAALIGPGIDASHNYERTHIDALVASTQWVVAYLLSK